MELWAEVWYSLAPVSRWRSMHRAFIPRFVPLSLSLFHSHLFFFTHTHTQTWKKFIHNLLLKLWTFGFAGVVLKEHNRFKAVPRVLDPELVNIKVYREPTGDSQYIFSERRDTLQHGPSGAFPIQHITGEGMLTDKPIPGVMVFEMDPPDQYGNLRSKVMCALEPRQFMQHLMRAECLAVSRMSDPPILLQHNNNNATDLADSVKVAVAADQSRIWQRPDTNGGMRRGAINLQGHNATLQSTLQNLGYKVNLQAQDAASGQVDGTPYNVFANQGPQLIDTVGDPWGTQRATFGAFASGAPMTQKVDLGPNREAKQHTPAREPQHLLQVMANYEERVAAIWGVPRSFFAQFSAGKLSLSPLSFSPSHTHTMHWQATRVTTLMVGLCLINHSVP